MIRSQVNNNIKTNRKLVEIYYWSKYQEDQKLAGGEIRAMYMIPELIKISTDESLLITPYSFLPERIIDKHRLISKILTTFMLPFHAIKHSILKDQKIKFIYCSTCYSWDTLPSIIIKLLTGAKIICISHDTPKQLAGYSFYRNSESYPVIKSILFTLIGRFQVFLLNYVDVPVSISQFALTFFKPDVRKRTILSSNGICKVVEESELKKNRPYDIVILGRIIPRKNVSNIFRSLSGKSFSRKIKVLVITNTNKDVTEPVIMGNLDKQLIDLTVQYDASETEKLNLLKQSKIYISLSRDENFSIATLEAASMGVALILSDYSFFRDIYGDAAIYVIPEKAESLWKEINEFLTSDDKLLKYRARSIELAKNYLYANIAEREYNKIIAILNAEEIDGRCYDSIP